MSSGPPELENRIITCEMLCANHGEKILKWGRGTCVQLPSVTPDPLLKCWKSIIFCISQWLRRSCTCLLNCVGRAHFRDRCMVILYWLLCGGQTVRLAAVCIGSWFGKYLSRAVGEQMWANLRLETYCHIAYQSHPKTILCMSLCIIPHPLL